MPTYQLIGPPPLSSEAARVLYSGARARRAARHPGGSLSTRLLPLSVT